MNARDGEVRFHMDGEALVFEVRVAPRSSRNEVLGALDGALKVALTSPPVDGAANAALVALLARHFAVPKRAVTIVRGERSKHKTVRVAGGDPKRLRG